MFWVQEVGNTADTPIPPGLKGNWVVPTGQRKFDLGGVWTHDLRIFRGSTDWATKPVREQVGVI